jgi:hypothetical protein
MRGQNPRSARSSFMFAKSVTLVAAASLSAVAAWSPPAPGLRPLLLGSKVSALSLRPHGVGSSAIPPSTRRARFALQCKTGDGQDWLDAAKLGAAAMAGAGLMALYNGPIDFAHTSRQGGSILAQTVEKVQSRRAEAFLEGTHRTRILGERSAQHNRERAGPV